MSTPCISAHLSKNFNNFVEIVTKKLKIVTLYISEYISTNLTLFFLQVININDKGENMEEVGLNITPKEFKQLSKWADEVYNIAVVIDYFCETQPDKEECYNLAPVVKYLHQEADLLNAFFIDHEKSVSED